MRGARSTAEWRLVAEEARKACLRRRENLERSQGMALAARAFAGEARARLEAHRDRRAIAQQREIAREMRESVERVRGARRAVR